QERIKKEEEFAEVLRRRLKTTRPKPISASTLIEEAIHRGTNPMKYPPTQTFIIKRQWLERRKAIKTKPAHLSSAELIKIDSCHHRQELPLIVEPNFDGVDLPVWIQNNLAFIEDNLLKHGGILFRGFDVKTQADFSSCLRAAAIELMSYTEGATPRTELSNK